MHSQEEEGKGEGVYRDGPFVAAVSERWFHSHSTTGGDSSLYHSAVCYCVWTGSRPKGRNVCLFPLLPEGKTNVSFHRVWRASLFCLFAFTCILVYVWAGTRVHLSACMQMSTSICVCGWEAHSLAIRCQELLFRLSEPDWIPVIQFGIPSVLNWTNPTGCLRFWQE